jgi:hypothetical protein
MAAEKYFLPGRIIWRAGISMGTVRIRTMAPAGRGGLRVLWAEKVDRLANMHVQVAALKLSFMCIAKGLISMPRRRIIGVFKLNVSFRNSR